MDLSANTTTRRPLAAQFVALCQTSPSAPDVLAFLNQHPGATPADRLEVLLAGQPLSDRWRETHLSLLEVARLVADLAEALHQGHQRGLVHLHLGNDEPSDPADEWFD